MSFLIMTGAHKKRMPKSIRKFIRTQKAQIRRGTSGVFLDAKKQQELIREMYNKLNLVK